MDEVKTELLYWVRDEFGGDLFTAQAASGVKVRESELGFCRERGNLSFRC